MPETRLFMLGIDVRCGDGHCGQVKSLVIDLAQDAVTHLLVQPGHRRDSPGSFRSAWSKLPTA
jgi:hypothetical protein